MKSRVRVGLLVVIFFAPAALIVYDALSLYSDQQEATLGSAPNPQQASTSAPSTTPSDTGGPQRALEFKPCSAEGAPAGTRITGSVSSSSHLRSLALSQPDGNRQVGRKDVLIDAEEPVYWILQLPRNRDDAQGALPKTYFVLADIHNSSGGVNSPLLATYVWGEQGNVLKIETQWLLSDGLPRYLQPNAKVSAHIDTDGYTSLLLSSARHLDSGLSPILHLVMVISWTNSRDVGCVETDLPQYQQIEQKPWYPLQFQSARGVPALSDWASVTVKTETVPNTGWGPPALNRVQGDEHSSYTYFRNPESRSLSSTAAGSSPAPSPDYPLWTDSEASLSLSMLQNSDRAFSEVVNSPLPFYKEQLPIRFISRESPIQNGVSVTLAQDFGEFRTLFITTLVDGRPRVIGARTVDQRNIRVAEARIISPPSAGLTIRELHYKDGRLIFHCNSTLDVRDGYKEREFDRSGRKEKDYYFIWPTHLGY